MEQEREEEFNTWKAKEQRFELEQALLKSKIRIEKGRPKPMDKLTKLYLILQKELAIPGDIKSDAIKCPYLVLDKLNYEDLQQVHGEIENHFNLIEGSSVPSDESMVRLFIIFTTKFHKYTILISKYPIYSLQHLKILNYKNDIGTVSKLFEMIKSRKLKRENLIAQP
jgi:hypothetical protein